ncbi:hypothetical protein L6164_012477 [Bauhinia variegata]|uniref:Uncharacterized protein n=1 Tax=Bauhinia variegata TaxID=167791 RepID=A0ACB9PA34_BAUVA|nr:hypothetical protein L6164_012477 [Bauhinia variegata]
MKRKSMDVGGENIAGIQMENLYEDLIHNILAFLPTIDATRCGVLSKALRSFWLSFPVLDLDFTRFASGKRFNSVTPFLHFVERSLQTRGPHIKKQLEKLRFSFNSQIPKEEVDDFEALVNRLLEFALEKSVKELDLHICCKRSLKHNPSFLRVLSLKSITSLKLKGFGYELSELNLTNPSLEYLSVYTCNTLKTIRVSSGRLKNIELNHCFDLQSVHVEAESLESFSYGGFDVNEKCRIDISACQRLQNLTLVSARLSTKFFEQLAGLLLLKFLCLISCFLPETLNICNFSLKTITIRGCLKLERVVISAKSLETFKYVARSWNDDSCAFDISACTSLTKVELKGAAVTDDWVNTNVSSFSFLQVLVLKGCKFLENVELKNKKLEILALEYCHNLKKADIDARNLLRFSYCGSPDLVLLITSAKYDAKIKLDRGVSHYWLGNLINFLPPFNHGKSLTLHCSSAEDLIFSKEKFLDKLHPLPDLRHLTVQLQEMPNTPTLVKLVENLLWFVPNPVVVTIVSGTKKYSLKFHYSDQIERTEIVYCCCHRFPLKCWRYHVGNIIMDNFEPDEKSHFEELFGGYLH